MGIIPIILIGTAAVAIGSYINKGLSTQHAADQLITDFRDILLGPVTLLYTDLIIRLKITNPTRTPITVSYIDADILLDGQNIGRIEKINWSQTIQPGKVNYFGFNMKISNIGAGAVLYQAIKNGSFPDHLVIKGHLTANGFDKEINQYVALQS